MIQAFINKCQSFYLGISIAISWAWGTSLILGIQIAQTKGLEAFLIWAIANCATLGIFGWLYKKQIIYPDVLKHKIVRIFTNIIQMFCLIIQLKILNETFLNYFGVYTSYGISCFIGIGLFILMYREGIFGSIFTDIFQGIFTICCLSLMAGICIYSEPLQLISLESSSSDIYWGIWSACILLSGIMTDIQHWQRAEINKNGFAFEWATVIFAIYLGLVLFLSNFEFTNILNILLLLTVIGVTTSTIDSIAVALHKDFGKKLGTLIGIILCISFGLLINLSVLNIWSYFGIIRVGLAIYILYWCFSHKKLLNYA